MPNDQQRPSNVIFADALMAVGEFLDGLTTLASQTGVEFDPTTGLVSFDGASVGFVEFLTSHNTFVLQHEELRQSWTSP